MAKVKMTRPLSGQMYGFWNPKPGDILEVTDAEADEIERNGWGEKAKDRKKVTRGGEKAETATESGGEEKR